VELIYNECYPSDLFTKKKVIAFLDEISEYRTSSFFVLMIFMLDLLNNKKVFSRL